MFKKVSIKLLVKCCLILLSGMCSLAQAVDIKGVRFWQDPEKTRVVFDLSNDIEYKLFSLEEPHRLVLDFSHARIETDVNSLAFPKSVIKSIRAGKHDNQLRLVIDLKDKVATKHFKLPPFQEYGHRLVLDLLSSATTKSQVKHSRPKGMRDVVIAIDAGHGGEDPGALGYRKYQEKHVTLAVAKKLASIINKRKGFRAFLTRQGDYYVSLRKRTELARREKADLFVSLHADGFPDKRVRGASVWVLSPNGANSEMGRWLEQREKSSDLLGGVESLADKDPLVAQVLIDLSMHYSVGESIKAGEQVLRELSRTMPKMHGRMLKKAAFVVLKMPDIPAMLVEMGFISNPTEEKMLKSAKQQSRIARSVAKGIFDYFSENPPDGTYLASRAKSRSYQVRKGDTLSEIASRFGVSVQDIKRHNNLKSSVLRIGQTLTIPGV